MIVEYYRKHRVDVAAVSSRGKWDAAIRIRRTLSDEKPHVETVTCRKPTASEAEERGLIYARRWIDRHSPV
jgi:hypothetical protein